MDAKVKQALDVTLRNWNAMSRLRHEDAEETANEFESSFYLFIDALSDWTYELDPQPQTLEEFLELPMIQEILDLLPAPLHLNFETEAELIVDHKTRIEDAKYD
ncbi:hypothetical protein PN4B1_01090 [Paenibacillus naphthalenovorans]|uniref:hypothetical protein n=1 Tax=Paenibacillus naphthalenovorans TaxID=162209 RepID=UPI0010B2BBAD|nr:hypothetical protein [Paenibacillus naphthalenovorans]GCL70209.1 hypothetical protein PN4B1_01090 [Paenibacillus naphthalenovorans]